MNKWLWLIMALVFHALFMTVSGQGSLSEELNIQTDRDVYLPGESVWFRADYKVVNYDPKVQLSSYLYIELSTPLGESVAAHRYELKEGYAAGEFLIPDGLVTATYMLQAYTQFQRNDLSNLFVNKLITIINPAVPLTGYKKKPDWQLKVYPLDSRDAADKVVLRVHPGIVKKVREINIVDQDGRVAGQVELYPNGLGVSEINRQDSLDYFAEVLLKNGDTVRAPIPVGKNKDTFDFLWKGSSGKVNVRLPEQNPAPDGLSRITVYNSHLLSCCTFDVPADGKWHEFGLDHDLSREKIIYLVLEDAEGAVIQAKHVLQLPDEPEKIFVSTSQNIHKVRGKVEVAMHTESDEDLTCSVSVVKKGTYENNLHELPVFIIENPQLLPTYLDDKLMNDSSFLQQMEAVLWIFDNNLQSGRLALEPLHKDMEKEWLPETRGITIRGEVTNSKTGIPEPYCDVYIAVLGNNPQLHVYTTNQQGEFFFSLKHICGLQSLYLCIGNKQDDDLEILVNSDFVRDFPSFYAAPLILDTSTRRFIEDLYVNAQVKEYFVEKDTSVTLGKQKAIRFPEPDESILLDDYIPFPTLKDVINEIVPFVRVARKGDDFSLVVLDKKTNQSYGNPLILLDDLPVFNVNELLKISPELINRISVMNSTYAYGEHIFRGIVFLETTTNNFAGMVLPASSTFLEFQAMENQVTYAPPEHREKDKRFPDFRNLLFWEPETMVGKDGVTVSFFCSDDPGEYEVIVRGISENGKKAFGSAVFVVRDK